MLCRFLRFKGWYAQRWRSEEELAAQLATSDAPFRCLKTLQSWGPDDALVAPECCGDGRACFELSRKSPRRRVDT